MRTIMKPGMEQAQLQLTRLLEQSEITAGMYVRVHGNHLIVGRKEPLGPGELDDTDRVRFTRLSSRSYGLSVMRHTSRWERTPFTGSMGDMVDTVRALMQHLVASY